MKIEKAGYKILTPISLGGVEELKFIEKVARVCYRSEDRITEDGQSARKLVSSLIASGHEAMIEHSMLSVMFTVDRGISHEIVRHRIASYAQESTRYCNYSKGKFGSEITVIKPGYLQEDTQAYNMWVYQCQAAEDVYFNLLQEGKTPQEARMVLPTSLKTCIVMTANYREWRNFFKLRTAKDAHPQMQEVTVPLLGELKMKIPVVFDDVGPDVFTNGDGSITYIKARASR